MTWYNELIKCESPIQGSYYRLILVASVIGSYYESTDLLATATSASTACNTNTGIVSQVRIILYFKYHSYRIQKKL